MLTCHPPSTSRPSHPPPPVLQYASAFHYLSSAINLKPDFAHSYMYLAITLSRCV